MAASGRKSNGVRRESAALLLAAGKTVCDAAAELGIGERTLHRWREDPAFSKRVKDLRAELFAAGMGQLANSHKKAADVLDALLSSANEAIRLSAARSVLQLGNELRKTAELEAELAALTAEVRLIQTRMVKTR